MIKSDQLPLFCSLGSLSTREWEDMKRRFEFECFDVLYNTYTMSLCFGNLCLQKLMNPLFHLFQTFLIQMGTIFVKKFQFLIQEREIDE
jgi:hypothetical protein